MDHGESIDIKKIRVVKIKIKAVGVENREHGRPCPHCVYGARGAMSTLCIQLQCRGLIQNTGQSADAPCCLFSMTITVFSFNFSNTQIPSFLC